MKVITEMFGFNNILSTDSIGDLGVDSIDIAEMILAMEDELKVRIAMRDINDTTKIADIVSLVKEKLARTSDG